MKVYLCVTLPDKRHCKSCTIVDTIEKIRELICFLNFFSYCVRIYETDYGLKIFSTVPELNIDKIVTRKEGEKYAKVSDSVLGKI